MLTNRFSSVCKILQHILTGNFDEWVLNEVTVDNIFPLLLLLLYKSACCCCIIVGEGEMPVDPGISDASIIFPFIIDAVNASWPPPPPYIVAIKYSTIDSASNADNCTRDFVAGSSSFNKFRWNAKMREKERERKLSEIELSGKFNFQIVLDIISILRLFRRFWYCCCCLTCRTVLNLIAPRRRRSQPHSTFPTAAIFFVCTFCCN